MNLSTAQRHGIRRAAAACPNRDAESDWRALGFRLVAGLDEVGRGPLAGPVVAAAVILPDAGAEDWIPALRDSKALNAATRETLSKHIRREAVAWGIGVVSAARIDRVGIVRATREAMRRALAGAHPRPDALLLDAFALPNVDLPQEAIVRGDGRCCAIAAASIVAKVARDRLMEAMDQRYPGYGFAHNRGYGTAEHLEALRRIGPCPIHRFSFAPLNWRDAS